MTILQRDPALLAGFRSGDRAALARVYQAYLDDVARLVRLGFVSTRDSSYSVPGIKSPQAQCDLIQEVFLRAFSESSRKNYDEKQPFRPYLLRIAKNLMIDELRRSRREGVSRDGLAEGAPGGEDDFAIAAEDLREQAQRERCLEAMRRFAAALPEPMLSLYRLRYQEGLAQEEVARRLTVSRRQVRRQEDELRDLLKKHLCENELWEQA